MINIPSLTVTLWEKYKYNITVPENPTLHDIAWAVSLEIHRKEKKTKFTGKPRSYNYIMECLLRKTAFNFRLNISTKDKPTDTRKEIYDTANDFNNRTNPIKVKCPCCDKGIVWEQNMEGNWFDHKCPKCNGHGFLIERNMYRVGDTFNHKLVIDIDSHDLTNLKEVKNFYEPLLNLKFRIFKTNGGYWLIGDRRLTEKEFKLHHCLALNPNLKSGDVILPSDIDIYIKNLLSLDKKEKDVFIGATTDDIKKSKYYHGHGNFDVAFTFLSIKRERSTLRESKKRPGDKIEEIFI